MADIKTSALPAAAAVNSTDVLAVVQGGVSKKATIAQVVANAPSGGSTSYTDEQAQDAAAALFAAGTHTGITFAYDDPGNRINATVTATGGSGNGTPATVDGQAVSTLAFSTQVQASDVGALPLPSGTPALGQTAVVSTVSPLALSWGAAGSSGSSSAGTLNALNYGAKNDGVILNDLTVTAGSTTITSAIGPFTSTAVDAGKLVYWRVGTSGVGSGVIATVQSTTQATLTSAPANGSTSDGGPNTNGGFGTDNTAAFNNLIALAGAKQAGAPVNRLEHIPNLRIHLPGGIYFTKSLNTITSRGGMITGDGYHSTFIASGENGPWFQFGAFNNNPSYVFNSGYNQEFWTFRDIQFINPCMRNGSTEGNRNSTAIQDNGNGDLRIVNCIFMGLKYGFAGAYATDFSKMYGNYFYLCDVGAYFGPGSQQVEVGACDFSYCREGIVFEGCEHWHIGSASSFEDNYVSSVTLDGTNGSATRFGLPRAVPGSWYGGIFVIDGNTWFETNSGNSSRLSPRQVWVTGDGPYGQTFQRLIVRDALIIAGGNQVSGGTNTFVEVATNNSSGVVEAQVILENLQIGGNYLNSVVRSTGSAQLKAHLRDLGVPSATAMTQGSVATRTRTIGGQLTGYTVSA